MERFRGAAVVFLVALAIAGALFAALLFECLCVRVGGGLPVGPEPFFPPETLQGFWK